MSPFRPVLVVERRKHWAPLVRRALAGRDIELRELRSPGDAMLAVHAQSGGVLVADLARPAEGIELIAEASAHDPHLAIIAIARPSDAALEPAAREAGALEFLVTPVDPSALGSLIERALALTMNKGRDG